MVPCAGLLLIINCVTVTYQTRKAMIIKDISGINNRRLLLPRSNCLKKPDAFYDTDHIGEHQPYKFESHGDL